MNTLVVVGYEDPFKAEEVHLKLQKMQKDYLIDIEDAVFAVKDKNGKVKLHQSVNLTAAGARAEDFGGAHRLVVHESTVWHGGRCDGRRGFRR